MFSLSLPGSQASANTGKTVRTFHLNTFPRKGSEIGPNLDDSSARFRLGLQLDRVEYTDGSTSTRLPDGYTFAAYYRTFDGRNRLEHCANRNRNHRGSSYTYVVGGAGTFPLYNEAEWFTRLDKTEILGIEYAGQTYNSLGFNYWPRKNATICVWIMLFNKNLTEDNDLYNRFSIFPEYVSEVPVEEKVYWFYTRGSSDLDAPKIDFARSQDTAPLNTDLSLRVEFSQDVSGLTPWGFETENATVRAVLERPDRLYRQQYILSGTSNIDTFVKNYDVTIRCSAYPCRVRVRSQAVRDAVGNSNSSPSDWFEIKTAMPFAAQLTGTPASELDVPWTMTVEFGSEVEQSRNFQLNAINAEVAPFSDPVYVNGKTRYTTTVTGRQWGYSVQISRWQAYPRGSGLPFSRSGSTNTITGPLDQRRPFPFIRTPEEAGGPFVAEILFSETDSQGSNNRNDVVTGFTVDDIVVKNGAVSSFTRQEPGHTYQAIIVPDRTGDVEISIPGGAADDSAGNPSFAADPVYTFYDGAAPKVSITGAPPFMNNTRDSFLVRFDFSEPVSNFDYNDLIISNGSIVGLSGGLRQLQPSRAWDALIRANGQGDISIDVNRDESDPNAPQDNSGNRIALLEKPVIVRYDDVAPQIERLERLRPWVPGLGWVDNNSSRDIGVITPTNADELVWQLIFSEPMTGVQARDFRAEGVSGADVRVTPAIFDSGRVYEIAVSGGDLADLNGRVYLSLVNDHNIEDKAGNAFDGSLPGDDPVPDNSVLVNLSARGLAIPGDSVYVLDNTSPVISLNPLERQENRTWVTEVTVEEANALAEQAALDVDDLVLTNTTAVVAGNGRAGNPYRIILTPLSDGEIGVGVGAAALSDAAGNASAAVASVTTIVGDGVKASEGALTLAENGGTQTYTLMLTSAPAGNVTVTPQSSDPSAATVSGPLTFTATNWQTPQTVTVTGVDDDIDNPNDQRTVEITHAVAGGGYNDAEANDLQVTVTDDDSAGISVSEASDNATTTEAGGQVQFTIALASQPTAEVRIDLASSDATEGTVAPARLTFTAQNWNQPQTVRAAGVDDALVDGGQDYAIEAVAASTDPAYEGIAAEVALTNRDNDTAGIAVSVASDNATTTEAGGTSEFTLALDSQPTAEVRIDLASSDVTEGTVAPPRLTFTAQNWNQPQTVRATGVDDSVVDGGQDYAIEAVAASTDPVYEGIAADVALTNRDDDRNGISVSQPALTLAENGGSVTYTLVLTSEPTSDVRVTPRSNDPNAATVSAALTFTPANWNQPREVTVTGVNDGVDNPNGQRSAIITHAVSGADYNGIAVDDVALTVTDGGGIAAPLFTSGTAFSTPENSTATGYTAQADTAQGSVTYAITDGADQALFAIDANSGEVSFRAAPDYESPQDADIDNLYNFTVTATATSAAGRATAIQAVQITVTDADEVSPTLSLALSHEQAGDPLGTTYNNWFWITVTFSEAVSGFDQATLNSSLTNATVSRIEPPVALADGRQAYDALIAPSGQGAVRFDFAGSDIGENLSDAAGNPVVSTNPALIVLAIYDTEGPTVEITGVPDSIVRGGTFTVTYTFSEQVGTTFDIHEVRHGLNSATASNFQTIKAGRVFRAELKQFGNGHVGVGLKANAAQDIAGNASVAVDPETAAIPGVTLSPSALTVAEGGTANYTVVLTSQPSGDVTITPQSSERSAATVSGSLTFTADNWDTPQQVTVTGINDNQRNPNDRRTLEITHAVSGGGYDDIRADDLEVRVTDDTSAPTVTSIVRHSPQAELTNAASLVWRVTFSEAVRNVDPWPDFDIDAAPFTISGSTAKVTGLERVGRSNSYDIEFSGGDLARFNGNVSLGILATHNITDLFGNRLVDTVPTSGQNSELTYRLDNRPPVVAIGEFRYLPSSGRQAIAFTISVTDDNLAPDSVIKASDLVLSNNVTDAAVSGSGAKYTVSFTTTDDQAIHVGIKSGAVRDLVGYGNAALLQQHVPEQSSLPSVNITEAPAEIGRRPFLVRYTFSKDVGTSFDLADVRAGLVNATASTFQRITPGRSFSAMITPDGEGDVTIGVPVNSAQDAAGNGNTAASQVVVRYAPSEVDDDGVGVTLSDAPVEVTEAGGTATYRIRLNSQPSGAVTITPQSADESAATVSGPLTFTATNWQTPQTVTVTGVNDDLDNADDARNTTVRHGIAGGGYDAVAVADVAVSVIDDDGVGVTLSDAPVAVTEAGGTATYRIRLNSQPSGAVTITPQSADESAATVSGPLTFTATNWQTPQTVTVTGVNDDVDNADDARNTTLRHGIAGGGYDAVAVADVAVSVIDDDGVGVTLSDAPVAVTEAGGTATYRIQLDSRPSGDVTITPQSADESAATVSGPLTFTATNWQTPQTVTVTGVNDDLDNADDARNTTVRHGIAGGGYDAVAVADVAVSVIDDDGVGVTLSDAPVEVTEAGGTATYRIQLDSRPSGDVTITPQSADESAATVSGPLTFTATNWQTPQTVTVTGVNDDVDNADDARNTTVRHGIAGGGYDAVAVADVAVSVIDDDGVGVTLSDAPVEVTEAGGTATYRIRLNSQPSGAVTITPQSADESAATVSGPLTFTATNWQTPQTVTVTGVNDDLDNADDARNTTVRHGIAGGGYDAVAVADVAVSVIDDDGVGVTLSDAPVEVTEAGGTATYRIRLDSQPSGAVTITPQSADESAATVSGPLTFTATNWQTPQTVTVTGVNDDLDNADDARNTTVRHGIAGGGYDAVAVADVAVSVIDDAGGTATYRIRLNSQPSGAVTITPQSADESAATVSGPLTFTATNWQTPQTVTVTGVNDDLDNADDARNTTVRHGIAGGGYDGIVAADVAVSVIDDDGVGVTLSDAPVEVTEAGGTATYRIRLNSQPSGAVTITPQSADESAATVSGPLTFTATNWQTPQTVTVTGVNDDLDNADDARNTTVRHGIAGGGYDGIVAADVAVSVIDDDGVGVTLSDAPVEVTEAGGTATYRIRLNSQPSGAVTITPQSADESAATVSGPLTFTATNWQTPQTVTVTGVNDDLDNADDARNTTVRHGIAGGGYDAVAVADVAVSVIDDDGVGVTLSDAPVEVTEAGGTATYRIRLNSQPSGAVTITPQSADESAATVSGPLTFTATNWQTPQTVTVTGVNDDLDNADDARNTTLRHGIAGGGYDAVAVADVAVSVIDDDGVGVTLSDAPVEVTEAGGTATYRIRLNSQPSGAVTITPQSADESAATVSGPLTFTATNWQTPQTVTVTGVNDDVDNADDARNTTVRHGIAGGGYDAVAVADVAVSVIDDDGVGVTLSDAPVEVTEAGGTATYRIRLNSQPSGAVTITPQSADESAATVSGPLTFTATNWQTPQTVTVTGVNDDVDNADDARNTTVRHGIAGGGYDAVAVADVAVSVIDDDGVGVTLSDAPVEVTEAGGTATYRIRLDSQPSGAVTITPQSADESAATVSGPLTFTATNWQTPQTVTVTGVNDDLDNADDARNTTVRHGIAGGGYDAVAVADVAVSVIDDDGVGVTLSDAPVEVTEAGGTATYRIRLNSQPSGAVTITPQSADESAATVSGPLTFTATNWQTPQTVTVTGVNDDLDNADDARNTTVRHGIAGGGYDGIVAADVAVSVIDDDGVGVTLSDAPVEVTEAGGTATYRIRLNSQPSGAVTITPQSADESAATVSGPLTFTATNWQTPQTVTVTGVNDDLDNADDARNTTVRHGIAGGGYDGIVAADVAVSVIDDDGVGVTLSDAPVEVTEAGGTATYRIRLNSQPSGAVTITPQSADESAATVSGPLTFTATNWQTPQTVTVTGVNDDVDNADDARNTTVRHGIAGGGYDAVAVADVAVSVIDDDGVGVTLSDAPVEVTEAGGTATYRIRLNSQPSGAVTITPQSADESAATVSGPLTFTATNWQTPQTVTVTGVNDDLDNADDARNTTLRHGIAGGGYDAVAVADVAVSVIDDDGVGVTLSDAPVEVTEAGGTATYRIRLNSQPSGAVTITPQSADESAATVSGPLTFTATNWQTPQTVTVTGVNDDLDNADDARNTTVRHGIAGGGYDAVAVADVAVSVIDDDGVGVTLSDAPVEVTEAGGTATYRIRLNSQPSGAVTITPQSADESAATVSGPLTFTATNWQTPQTVTVTGVNDDLDNADDARNTTVRHGIAGGGYDAVAVADVAVSVIDDDGVGVTLSDAPVEVTEAGGTATYRIRLNSQPSGAVTITPQSADESAATVSGPLTFTATNWQTPQTVTVTGVNDDVDNADDARNTTLRHGIAGGGYDAVAVADVAVSVIDDDGVGVTLSDAPVAVTEAGGTATYRIQLDSRPSGDVTITPQSADESAATVSGPLTFTATNWQTPQTVTVTGVNDDLDNADDARNTTVRHGIAGGGYDAVAVADVAVSVIDDDGVGVTLSDAPVEVTEAGGTATYRIQLDSRPSGDVTITPQSADESAATVSGPLTFTATNWQTPQTVTVTGVNDDVDNADDARNTTIRHGIAGGGYDAVAVADVSVTVSDDDEAVVATTVSITAPAEINTLAPFDVTILFSRPVSGFTADDIEVAKGRVTGLERGGDGTLWTATMAPDAALAAGASMTIGIAASVVEGGNNPLHAVKMTYIRPLGKVTLVVNAADSGSVRFSSSTPGLDDLAVAAASGGRGVRGPISVPAGEHVLTYTLPLGYSVTAAACSSAGSSVDREARRLTLAVEPAASVTCTLSVQGESLTALQVGDFLEDRARLILSHRSDTHRRIARLKGQTRSAGLSVEGHEISALVMGPLRVAVDGTAGSERASLSYSCTQKETGCGRTDRWFESTVGGYKRRGAHSEADGKFAIVQGGMDRLLNSDLLVGIELQYDRVTRKHEDATVHASGDGWMLGPYITARMADNLYFDAGLSAGTASNRIRVPAQGSADWFPSWRVGVHGTLSGDYEAGRFMVRPSASLLWFEETAKAWTDSNGLRIPEVRTRRGDLETGLRVEHNPADTLSSQYVEIEGVFALAGSEGPETEAQNRLRLQAGATIAAPFGGILDAGLSFDGLVSDDWQALSFTLGYSLAPSWLPGHVDAGLSFDGESLGAWSPQALRLGFRSDPDAFGGVFSTDLSLDARADGGVLSGTAAKLGYELRF